MLKLRLESLLKEKKVTRYQLSKETEIKYQTIDNYYKNKVVRYDSYILNAICNGLNCTPGELFEYEKDEN